MASLNRAKVYKAVTPSLSTNATSNLTAINAALLSAKGTDTGVYIPSGSWPYNGAIVVDSCLLFGESDSILVGSDGTTSPQCPVRLIGNNPSVSGLTVQISGATVRGTQKTHAGVLLDGCIGGTVSGVTSRNAASCGIFTYGGNNNRTEGCTVVDSLADGIHHTNTAINCESSNCTVTGAGDDMISVVSYAGAVCSNINIHDFAVADQKTTGRGITVVGGTNITYRNGTVRNTQFRGIYIASETSFATDAVVGVTLKDITVDGTGLNGVNADPGAAGVWVGGRAGFTVSGVSTSNIKVLSSSGAKTLTSTNTSGIDLSGVS